MGSWKQGIRFGEPGLVNLLGKRVSYLLRGTVFT